ncbi:hypothetical protein [Ottowia sp.]|uniref:hypothetical protein n=1 Tax=Ottowia sp. TaxID=1898956 RepID=UPI00260031C5|nr:hypothetical protein [Ottowia sp.]
MTRDSLKPTASERRRGSGPWGPERRLEFIDFRLQWDGRLNRSDLMEHFGISVPQASADIAAYAELAPDNLVYDRSARVYVASSGFAAVFPTTTAEHYLNDLLALNAKVLPPEELRWLGAVGRDGGVSCEVRSSFNPGERRAGDTWAQCGSAPLPVHVETGVIVARGFAARFGS